MAKYKAAVLGLGSIFTRHLAALQSNPSDFEFISYFDPDPVVNNKWRNELSQQYSYSNEEEAYTDSKINCLIILTPSYLHFTQAKTALINGKHVIVEKPAAFSLDELKELEALAKKNNVNIFCVLQVRLNQSITIVKKLLDENLLGEIRSSGLIQRWQRPLSYFTGWRETYAMCGGVLNEFGIHYLDIMQYLLGVPKVISAKFYHTKFKDAEVDDSAYALFDFGSFGATMEICLTSEPRNIEVSLMIMGSQGFIKLGGKSLDQIISAEFLSDDLKARYEEICREVLGFSIDNQVAIGACPHHPELYKQIVSNPQLFNLPITYNVIELIGEINRLGSIKC